ncbi:hypothetical protein QJS04_geneDACA012889 [Acorus gramineus]|uniref:Uncharacterized protein n=1 Tax=Acorus gramineus TaxID=55184 RepID=A0AAV9BJX5_ACOGR|nr:hypothetical protein QJS04_geneDACA012889 [Acorus gramineus]
MLKLVRGGCLNGLRGKQLSLTLIAVFCTTLLIWAWNRTSHIATFLSQSERFEILPPVIYINKTTSNPGYPKLQTPLTNGNLNSSISEESVTAKEEQELGAAPKGSADQNSYEKGDGKRFVGSSTTEKKVAISDVGM